jgi:small subunit ribosomal protein S4
LREKQKARRIFGLSERQFRKYFELASKTKGSTGGKLMEYLERRLDNVVYRLSIAPSRAASRQMVRDGHVLINGKKVNIPSYLVSKDEVIGIKEKSLERVKAAVEKAGEKTVPAWMSFDKEKIEGKVLSIPRREEMDAIIEENLIVEFYSR